jgi:hypothetical protein
MKYRNDESWQEHICIPFYDKEIFAWPISSVGFVPLLSQNFQILGANF